MSFDEFVALAQAGEIERLHVESAGPEAFQYRAFTGAEGICLLDEDGGPLQEKCFGHARQRLRCAGDLTEIPLFLIQYVHRREGATADGPQLAHRTPFSVR